MGDGVHIFPSVAPAFCDVGEGDVGWDAGGEIADGGGDFRFILKIGARKSEAVEQLVEIDPRRHRVVVRERKLVLFARHGETFEETDLAIDAGETAAAVFDAAADDFEGEAGVAANMLPEHGGIGIGAERVDVVQHEIFELRIAPREFLREHAVAAGGLEFHTSGRWDAGIAVGRCRCSRFLTHGAGPTDEGGVQALADFLLLLIENLLRHFLPGEAEIALGGNEPQADGAATRKMEWAGVVVAIVTLEILRRWRRA